MAGGRNLLLLNEISKFGKDVGKEVGSAVSSGIRFVGGVAVSVGEFVVDAAEAVGEAIVSVALAILEFVCSAMIEVGITMHYEDVTASGLLAKIPRLPSGVTLRISLQCMFFSNSIEIPLKVPV